MVNSLVGKKGSVFAGKELDLNAHLKNSAPDFDGVPAFDFFQPADFRVPYLFNVPHSGRHYPLSFLDSSVLDAREIRSSEDAYVDILFEDVVRQGAAVLKANFPRAFLDINRGPFELEGAMFKEELPDFARPETQRASAGLGTVPRVVSFGQEIYNVNPSLNEAIERISRFYFSYHEALEAILQALQQKFSLAVMIDCHSMPSNLKFFGNTMQPDFILGNCHGRSCSMALSEYAAQLLSDLGYTVVFNRPYAGGYITSHYGAAEDGRHVLQIEINRALYLDEYKVEKKSNFVSLQRDLMRFSADLMSLPEDELFACRIAAE